MEHVGVSPLRDSQGRIQTDDKKKATILNDQFASVFSKEDESHHIYRRPYAQVCES